MVNFELFETDYRKHERWSRAEEDAQKYKITKVIAGLRFRPIDDVVA